MATRSFAPASYSAFGATSPVKRTFNTVRTGADRTSVPVHMLTCYFDQKQREIKVMCNDGKLRTCKIDRLQDSNENGQLVKGIDKARKLWKDIQEYGANKLPVQFTAAGGFSPDTWFYKVEPVSDEDITLGNNVTTF
jgi:hypothetical protein